MTRIERSSIVIWVVIAMSASLNNAIPYLQWLMTGALFPVLIFNAKFSVADFRAHRTLIAAASVFVLSVLGVALVSNRPLHDLMQAIKLSAILLIILPVCISRSSRRRALWQGAEYVVYLNLALVIGGLTISPALFSLQGFARFGTYTAGPGDLWRIGAIGIAAAVVVYRRSSRLAKCRALLCLMGSVMLIALDGSRTGFIVLGLAVVLYAFSLLRSFRYKPRKVLLALAVLGTILAVVGISTAPWLDDAIERYGVIARVQTELQQSGSARISAESLDTTRSDMLHTAISAIDDHPIVGTGMATTVSDTPTGPMVVHCSFLQIWADIGLLGFISYSTLLIIPVFLAVQYRINARKASQGFAFYPGYLTIGWMLTDCFHPVSTEISEWIWFVIAVSSLADCHCRNSRPIISRTLWARMIKTRKQLICVQ